MVKTKNYKMLNKLKLLLLLTVTTLSINSNAQRTISTINSNWKFINDDYNITDSTQFDQGDWTDVNIPHTWNITDILDDKKGYNRGVSWYVKELNIGKQYNNKRVSLLFEAVSIKAEVYINGKFVGEHLGAYTAFSFDISDFINYNSSNVVSVKVDNSENRYTNPLSGDFSMPGGIYRDVYLISTNDIHFSDKEYSSTGIYITTPNVTAKNATIGIKANIKNNSDKSRKIVVKNSVLDMQNNLIKEFSSKVTIKPKTSKTIEFSNTIDNQHLWSPENPYLYSVKSQIIDASSNKVLDEINNPLGFRWFSVDAKKGFFFNGNSYKLKGAARHQD